jgi:hypothetical protein
MKPKTVRVRLVLAVLFVVCLLTLAPPVDAKKKLKADPPVAFYLHADPVLYATHSYQPMDTQRPTGEGSRNVLPPFWGMPTVTVNAGSTQATIWADAVMRDAYRLYWYPRVPDCAYNPVCFDGVQPAGEVHLRYVEGTGTIVPALTPMGRPSIIGGEFAVDVPSYEVYAFQVGGVYLPDFQHVIYDGQATPSCIGFNGAVC